MWQKLKKEAVLVVPLWFKSKQGNGLIWKQRFPIILWPQYTWVILFVSRCSQTAYTSVIEVIHFKKLLTLFELLHLSAYYNTELRINNKVTKDVN